MKQTPPLRDERIEQLLAAVKMIPPTTGTVPVRLAELRSLLLEIRAHRAAPTIAAELHAACRKQSEAIDMLFARLIQTDVDFFPRLSGAPWRAQAAADAVLAKIECAL